MWSEIYTHLWNVIAIFCGIRYYMLLIFNYTMCFFSWLDAPFVLCNVAFFYVMVQLYYIMTLFYYVMMLFYYEMLFFIIILGCFFIIWSGFRVINRNYGVHLKTWTGQNRDFDIELESLNVLNFTICPCIGWNICICIEIHVNIYKHVFRWLHLAR